MASRRRRRHPCSPAVGPLEDDDLLIEILVRLPPQPSSLPRASAVCRRWRLLLSDPGFSRRFRIHHRRNPPLLGFFVGNEDLPFRPTLDAPDRVSPGRFSLQRGDGDRFMPLGCRHGLVLVFNEPKNQILVWDPVTGDQHCVDVPPVVAIHAKKTRMNGAVLRAAGDGDQHFRVVLTVADNDDKQHRRVLACVYSSETGAWGDLLSAQLPSGVPVSDSPALVSTYMRAVLIGDSLYWRLAGIFYGILEFDLEKQSLAVIPVPVHILEEGHLFSIMPAEGGGLGLLLPTDGCSIQLWKRKTDCDGVASWWLGRTIELDKLLSLNSEENSIMIQGAMGGNNVVLVWTHHMLFTVHLESLQFNKLSGYYPLHQYHPFERVYAAGI
ncbi:F-box protein At5g03970 [Hordeum vulgare subsp. vulgare]|uniref:F-box protein At5g03970 n=1 Tax=Hordeum vulgare subsp. vulgare TaxID=112509 RepID=UPI001B851D74|nr:F-box protein At5g03970 [Hordeum vulgare subsp. vulgare]